MKQKGDNDAQKDDPQIWNLISYWLSNQKFLPEKNGIQFILVAKNYSNENLTKCNLLEQV